MSRKFSDIEFEELLKNSLSKSEENPLEINAKIISKIKEIEQKKMIYFLALLIFFSSLAMCSILFFTPLGNYFLGKAFPHLILAYAICSVVIFSFSIITLRVE